MDSRAFPFDKLIKIFFLILSILLPFGLYYYHHTKDQTSYLNQRNFRALNEIILQYQNHFEALGNLFKLAPSLGSGLVYKYEVDQQTKKNLDSIKQDLKDIFFNKEDTVWIDWSRKQLLTIDLLYITNWHSSIADSLSIKKTKEAIKKDIFSKLKNIKKMLADSNKREFPLTISKDGVLAKVSEKERVALKKRQSLLETINSKIDDLKIELTATSYTATELGESYQDQLRLNESLGDISFNEGKIACTANADSITFSFDHNSLPVVVKVSKSTRSYSTSVSALVGRIRQKEFDAIMLIDSTGRVIYSKELKALDWKEEIGSHSNTNYTGLAIRNIKHILEKTDTDKKEGSSDIHEALVIGYSRQQTENIGGRQYKLFIQPFDSKYSFCGNDSSGKEHWNQFYMIGFVDEEKFNKEIYSISATHSAFVFVVLFCGILSWPSVKLNFMGVRECLDRGDLHFLFTSLFIISGAVSIFLCTLLTMEMMEKKLNAQNTAIGNAIRDDFRTHIQEITKDFNLYKNLVLKENNHQQYQIEHSKNLLRKTQANTEIIDKKDVFPPQRDIFTVDKSGDLSQKKVHFFIDRFKPLTKLNIKNRDYFKSSIKGKSWFLNHEKKEESGHIYLQRIRNYSDGIKSTQMAMPIKNIKVVPYKGKVQKVLSSTTYFESLVAPILPYGFQYAIIDDDTGKVLYHSQDSKAFAENFYSETEYNNELIAAIKIDKERKIGTVSSISGTYHADQTNFHIIPLKTAPWSLITFYPKSLAHSMAIQTGITSFVYFILYTALLYTVIYMSRFFRKMLSKHSFNYAWLWPERHKKNEYVFFTLLLIPFSIIYLLGVCYFEGGALPLYLITMMLIQILFIHLVLNKKMIFQIPKIAILFQYKSIYISMLTLTLIFLSSIPAVALYKDALSLYSAIHSRQSQLELANAVQQRYTKLDTFSKLFFPFKHGTSDGYTKCSSFGFANKYTGIYLSYKEKLLLDINKDPKIDHYGCPIIHNNNSSTLGSAVDQSFSGFLFQQLAGLNFYLSLQDTSAQNHFINNDWFFSPDTDTLNFTTMGIGGTLLHSIESQKIGLSTVFSTLWWGNDSEFGLLASTKIACYLLTITFFFWFYLRVKFIVRRVFGIDIPEIVKNNKIENLISDELELSEQCLIFINGIENSIRKFCEYKIGKKNIDFALTPISSTEFKNFISCFEIKNDAEVYLKFYVISEFIAATNNQKTRIKILDYLEKLQKEARLNKTTFILICAEIHPLRCLIKPELFIDTQMQQFAYIDDYEEKYRWIKVLTKFCEYNDHLNLNSADNHIRTNNHQLNQLKQYIKECLFWPNPDNIREKANKFLTENKNSHEVTKEEIIEYVGNNNYPYYRRLWSLCNINERLMLYQLATDCFVNPENKGVIRSLYSRGYIERKPFFMIPDQCFKEFILGAEPIETFQKWEKNAKQSLWANIKVPLFVLLIFLAGLFIYMSTNAIDTTISLLTPLLAFIPLLLRSISTVQASSMIDKIATTQEDDSE